MLLVDCRGKNSTLEGITNQSYFKKMKEACSKLNINSKHFVHFGRAVGAVCAELEEMEGYNIDDLGNWNVNVRRNVYSAKNSMRAMRIAAGHHKEREAFYVWRNRVVVPKSLQKMVFGWVDFQLAKVSAHAEPLPTANAFLKMIVRLRCVFLQACAKMIIRGCKHILFQDVLFLTHEFVSFRESMRIHLSEHTDDPIHAKIQHVLPNVWEKLNTIQGEVQCGFHQVQNTMLTPLHIHQLTSHVLMSLQGYTFPGLEASISSTVAVGNTT